MKFSHPISLLMAGGGTGGHLWPGVALAEAILSLAPQAKIRFFVPGKPVDKAILQTTRFPWLTNPMRSLPRAWTMWPRFFGQFMRGWGRTLQVFRQDTPDMVVGLGGYGAWSACVFAHYKRIPFVLLESNRIAGKVIRSLAAWAEAIYSSGAVSHIDPAKLKILGIPVRPDLPFEKSYSVQSGQGVTVLVMGGSQGAKCINDTICAALPYLVSLDKRVRFIHLCGGQTETIEALYQSYRFDAKVFSFYPRMSELYREADFIICRAGGSTLAEIEAIGLPAILIPFAKAADAHQQANAQAYAAQGAACVIPEHNLSGQALAEIIERFVLKPSLLEQMAGAAKNMSRPHAAFDIAQDILTLTRMNI